MNYFLRIVLAYITVVILLQVISYLFNSNKSIVESLLTAVIPILAVIIVNYFYKKRTKELQQTLILCFQEGEESIELEMGWNQYIENKLSIHGETYLVAVKGELSSDVDDNPVLKVEIVYLEEAMRRKLYVIFVKDTSASKLITPEYIEIKWYESPGKALIMEGMESITTEVTKHPIYSRIRENGGIDLLHRLMEQTIEPVIKGKLIITDTH